MVSVFDKARMPYTRAVLLELLRFASIVPTGIPHMAIQDTTLAGYTVRKGTPVSHFKSNIIKHRPIIRYIKYNYPTWYVSSFSE